MTRRRFTAAATALLRFRHPLLWGWLVFMLARNGPDGGVDWSIMVRGSRLLFGDAPGERGGLHLFADEPQVHSGPLGLLVASFFRLSFADGRFAAMLSAAALGPLLVLALERAAVKARGLRNALDEPLLALVTLVSGAFFLRGWVIACWVYVHLEEVLVMAGATLLVWCVVTRHAMTAAAAVGLSIAAKLSAVLLVPLFACFSRRQAMLALTASGAIAGAAWLPFFIADFDTLDAAKGSVGVFPQSGLRVLGVDSAFEPGWVRPTQVVLGLFLGGLAVLLGRWEGALLAAFAARLAIDPSTSGYYTGVLAFAALVWDFSGRRPLPLLTPLIVATHILVPRLGAGPDLEGIARFAVAVAAILVVLTVPRGRKQAAAPALARG